MKNIALPWVAGACGVGLLLGGIFAGRVEAMLYYVAQGIIYRPFLFLLIILVCVAAYSWITYTERQEIARTTTELTAEEKQRIKVKIEHNLTTRKHEISRQETKMNSNRERFRDMQVRLIKDIDTLHKELTEFVWFVDYVNELLDRRSQKLRDALPENPVAADKVRERDRRMREELTKTVEMIRDAFPDLANSIPTPRHTILSSGQIPENDGEIEVLELKQEAERIAEYETIQQSKGRVTKH